MQQIGELTCQGRFKDAIPLGQRLVAGAEAMAGKEHLIAALARAFFYAGARALLVSHWAVDSEATVELITKAFAEIQRDGTIGRAEALRRSMLALIARGGRYAHPAAWAPFIVVGEGASQSRPSPVSNLREACSIRRGSARPGTG